MRDKPVSQIHREIKAGGGQKAHHSLLRRLWCARPADTADLAPPVRQCRPLQGGRSSGTQSAKPGGVPFLSHYTPAVSLFKSASTVSLLTLASRITGLVRELLMASVFGVSALTDAFNVAFRIPNLFRRVLGEGAFSQAFVPVLAATRASDGDDGAKVLINHVATLLAWTLVLHWRTSHGLGHGQRAAPDARGF